MSIFSDYKVGALSDFEFEEKCKRMNRIDRWEREQEDLVIDDDEDDEDYPLGFNPYQE